MTAGADEPGALEHVIAERVRLYRLAAGLSISELAAKVGLSKAMLSKVENAQTSSSLTTIGRLAAGLEIPVTALFRGFDEAPEASFVAAGQGSLVVRSGTQAGHRYELLGHAGGSNQRLEATLVTLSTTSQVFPLFQHAGTEFLYMLDGVMRYGHGELTYELRAGDALQFDGQGPHGPAELVEVPIRFLSVKAYRMDPAPM